MPDHQTSPSQPTINLFCFGYSYSAKHLTNLMVEQHISHSIKATSTRPEKKERLKNANIKSYMFDEHTPLADAPHVLKDATHILISIPPLENGDPAFMHHADAFKDLPNLQWIGYLSTTGVYGNRDGSAVTENSTLNPTSKRGSRRVKAERQWLSLFEKHNLPLHVFRLSGIYGPGRSAIDSVMGGTARRIHKPNHVFNRVHVDDIAQTLLASMLAPKGGETYNLADDHPAPSHEVIAHACKLLGLEPSPLIDIEDADLSPMARSFYKDHKVVKNDKIKEELGITLLYPDYKAGLNACLEDQTSQSTLSPLSINS